MSHGGAAVLEVRSPSDGSIVGRVPSLGPADEAIRLANHSPYALAAMSQMAMGVRSTAENAWGRGRGR